MLRSKVAMLNCIYCNNIYNNPKILNCLHSLCKECITKLQQDEKATSIVCPTCNESTPWPEKGVSSLPSNIRLREKAEEDKMKQKVTTNVPVPCNSCDDDDAGSSIAYCNDCKDFLCEECWKAHQKVKLTKSHSSFLLGKESSTSKVDTPTSSSDNDPKCFDHMLSLKYYCMQCSIPVCAECFLIAHNGHPVCEMGDQAEESKPVLQNIIEKLTVNAKSLETVISAIDDRKKLVRSRKSEVENVIKQAFAKLYESIRKREEALLRECNELAIAKETRLTLQQESIQGLLSCLNLCCSLSSIATSKYTDVQLLSIARTLLNRAINLQEQFTNTPTDVCEMACIKAEVNTDSLIAMVAEVGLVVDSSPCSNNTTVIIPRTKLGLGAEMKVTVVSRDRSDTRLDKGGSVVRCSLRYSGGIPPSHLPPASFHPLPALAPTHSFQYGTTMRGPRVKLKEMKGGEIITTPEGIKKKVTGKQWRTLCGMDNCWKASQKSGLCTKHHNSLISPPAMPSRRSNGIKRSMSNIQDQIEDSTDGIDLGSKKKRRMDSQPDGINSFPNNGNSKQPQETEYCVNDNNDGTYTATIQSKILGQHQLSITINGQAIQGSPFRLEVVPQRDYRNINDPVQVVDNAGSPRYIAFSDDGNMFVTCSDKSICVYDSTGQWKTTIGSIKGDGSEGDGSEGDDSEEEGDGELQFNDPWGLAVSGDIIYVAELCGQRIHKLTTGGESLGTYGEEGTSAGQFTGPFAVGISPDGKIYVSDCGNRVQVFNPDWSLSRD